MDKRIKHFMYCPWTGLGLYNGFRGNRWLRNRIKVFKQFVVPSLQAQTNKDFTLWCSWRYEEKYNPYVKELLEYMQGIKEFKTVFTYSGVCFWDDKYDKVEARNRLLTALHGSMGELSDAIGEVDEVLMTIQPSDDCYDSEAVAVVQHALKGDLQAVGFKHGYIMDYTTRTVCEYNPTTNPPFYTIKFPKKTFIDPLAHAAYTSLKHDVPGYEAGIPLPSHEWVGDCLNYGVIQERGFLVGTHNENISTVFNHPFRGATVPQETLKRFGIYDVPSIVIKTSIRRAVLRRLPFKVQRKLRYWIGERFWQQIYNFLRS